MLEIDPLEPDVVPVNPVDPEPKPPVEPTKPEVNPDDSGHASGGQGGKPTANLGFKPVRMSESKKHRDFVREPMGDKSVKELPGIGKVLGNRLERRGIAEANQVYGEFLTKKQDETKFKDWVMGKSGANAGQQAASYNALKDHHRNFNSN